MKTKFIAPITIILIALISLMGCTPGAFPGDTADHGTENKLEIIDKLISVDDDFLESNIIVPVFFDEDGEYKQEVLNELSKTIEGKALKARDEVALMAEEDFESRKKEDIVFNKYEFLVDYQTHTANNKLLSITTLTYEYTGGAHGLSGKTPYNIDLTTGKEITLEYLFKKDSNYKNILDKEIQKQIKEDPDRFFPDQVELFSGIHENQDFYIKNGQLIIYFQQYDIAPYSSGIVEFEIPNDVLTNIINFPKIK